jgi:hypothetical protein
MMMTNDDDDNDAAADDDDDADDNRLLSHGGHLEKTYCLCPLSLAFKSFQSRPREAEQLILFS